MMTDRDHHLCGLDGTSNNAHLYYPFTPITSFKPEKAVGNSPLGSITPLARM